MLDVDYSEFVELERQLGAARKKAIPHAIRNALNQQAFTARKDWTHNIRTTFITRNKWTERSIFVDKAKGTSVDHMQSTVGSLSRGNMGEPDYMRKQEFGTTHVARGKHGVPIPTSSAAGQAMGSQPRTRTIRQRHLMSAFSLHNRIDGSRKHKNTATVAMAMRTGRKHVFLEFDNGKKGIFWVGGNNIRRKWRIRMIYDLSEKSVTVPPNPTLGPAVIDSELRAPAIFVKAVKDQLRFHKILGY